MDNSNAHLFKVGDRVQMKRSTHEQLTVKSVTLTDHGYEYACDGPWGDGWLVMEDMIELSPW